MLPFLTIFIVFCVLLTYHIKKGDSSQQQVMDEFFEKERQSNAIRKKDLSNLDYITIPLEKIPLQLHTATEEKLFALAKLPIVNLSGISNTDLKLTYGTTNLERLSQYDIHFTDMVALLPVYAKELQEAGYPESACELLEFDIDCNADSRKIYQMLIDIYKESNNFEKLTWLKEQAQHIPSETTKQVILKDLHNG